NTAILFCCTNGESFSLVDIGKLVSSGANWRDKPQKPSPRPVAIATTKTVVTKRRLLRAGVEPSLADLLSCGRCRLSTAAPRSGTTVGVLGFIDLIPGCGSCPLRPSMRPGGLHLVWTSRT